ncbi:Glycosyltransferase involved in cell wall biogeneis [Arcticibacter svalbardensis MN12-7]|uniref:Glycosyltransferase involved in cell wall biogeneis n=1 Tax=Arcticibacter svalbardensis MN12-7 TaxID=1150600 RepID=R9GTE0_9SPHI|nr:glycosyltransferase family A protein [Arcticibacter svalbardensis]EOR94986.1 Glycosyltransferase involved in cell wall biogeneis [Arcticibacter svalbardensis MN12-7]
MNIPHWIEKVNLPYTDYAQIPQDIFDQVNQKLDHIQGADPLITILIAAYNEEVNILRCLYSLSRMQTNIPLEIIVINNNSSDHTQITLDKLHVKKLFQEIQGCGPSRQLGQEQAKGKYILLADADCLYPDTWVNEMMKVLQKPGTACVYGRYSFIPEPGYPRWKLFLLEKMKDVIAGYRHIKRPYLNAYGISMGYVKEFGLKAGFIMVNVRGDDGRLAFDMMQYGKIEQVKSAKARPWTGPRTLERDGSFTNALKNRVLREIKRSFSMLKGEKAHDTKTSSNED